MSEIDEAVKDVEELGYQEEDTLAGKYLSFHIGDELYGILIRYVTEIIGIQNVTEVPGMPKYVKGVINLRGSVIPVLDVRLRFGFDERVHDDRTCIVVVNIKETSVGFIVDSVNEVADIPDNQIEPAPRMGNSGENFIENIGKVGDEVMILLDVSKMLFDEDLKRIQESAESNNE